MPLDAYNELAIALVRGAEKVAAAFADAILSPA